MPQPAMPSAAHAAMHRQTELAGRDLGGMTSPVALVSRISAAVAPSANPLRYNGFAASLQLAIRESYSRPMTPATMATSAMLKTYQ